MAVKLGNNLDFGKNEAQNAKIQNLASTPGGLGTGDKGLIWFDTTAGKLRYWDGTQAVDASGAPDATTSSKGIVQLAGDLAGTAASPTIAAGAVDATKIAASLKPSGSAGAGTEALRALGSTSSTALAGNTRLDQVAAPTASVSLNSQKITSLLDPGAAQDAATKAYVDSVAAGLSPKTAVVAMTTANVTISNPGTSSFDGVTLSSGDRLLVANQSTQAENGIYIFNGSSSALTRATDADSWAELPSASVWVEKGTANADTGWVCTSDPGGTLGTTAVTWTQYTASTTIAAGTGLSKSGNTISLSSPVSVGNGGTGQATAKAARETGLSAAGYYDNAATHSSGTTITITQATHGLRSGRGLLVQVKDNSTGAVEIPDISVASGGDVTITYSTSQSANSKLVTIIG